MMTRPPNIRQALKRPGGGMWVKYGNIEYLRSA